MSNKNATAKQIAAAISGNLSTPMDFIACALLEIASGVSKAAVARSLGVSSRTVGRMVDRAKHAIVSAGVSFEEISDLRVIKNVHKSMSARIDGHWFEYSRIVESLKREGVPPVWDAVDTPKPSPEVTPMVGPDPIPEDCEEVSEDQAQYAFVLTGRSLVLTRYPHEQSDAPETVTILPSDARFAEANARLMGIIGIDDEDEKNRRVGEMFGDYSVKEQLKRMDLGKVHVDFTAGTIEVEIVSGDRVPVTGAIVNRIINEKNPERLVRFVDNLYENPSYRSITGLFDFLQATDIEIDDEGYVIAMKVVTHDYLDCYTKKIDNSVGAVVKMDRRLVDDDPESLCSQGLHACSESYIAGFRSGNDRLVKVRIHPKDFVSVPKAYTRTVEGGSVASKARVCEYTVIEEIKD